LGSEVRDKLDLLLSEWSYFLTDNGYCANQLIFLEHRNRYDRSNASSLSGATQRVIMRISWVGQYVRNMYGRLCLDHTADGSAGAWTKRRFAEAF
jgi:hypothetical protein